MVQIPSPTRQEFRKEGVIVTIPVRARPIQAQRLALPVLEPIPAVPGEFKHFRPVINLKLVDASQPDTEVLVFDPPIEVRVRYTAADVAAAEAAGGRLCLGFWDGKQWIRFTLEEHQFRLEPGGSPEAGWGVVSVSHWGDPTLAWGT